MGPEPPASLHAPRGRRRRAVFVAAGLAALLAAGGVVVARNGHDRPISVDTASRNRRGNPVPVPGPDDPTTTGPQVVTAPTQPPTSPTSPTSRPTGTSAAPTPSTRPKPRPTTTTSTTAAAGATTPVPVADRPGIYAVDADGTNLRRINTPQPGYDPQWSPDGRKIAYLVDNGAQDIHVFDLVTGVDHKLDGDFSNAYARLAWSPDSAFLAYPGLGDGSDRDIWVVPADGSGPGRRIAAFGDDSAVAWGPGGRLATMSIAGVATFNADGSDRRVVDSQGLSYGMIEWSPQGDHLLVLPVGTATDLLVDVDGDNPRELGGGSAANSNANFGTFSPDGSRVVYSGMAAFKAGTIVAGSDGSPGQVVADWVTDPVWAPGGDVIAGLDSPEGRQERVIVTFAADGSQRRTILDLPHDLGLRDRLSWAPDGSALTFTVEPYVGPATAVPRPVVGMGAKCGQPAGLDGNAVQASASGDGYSVLVMTTCESPLTQNLTLIPEVHHQMGTFTGVHIDYGDGGFYDDSSAAYSCDNRGPDPWYGNSPAHTYANPGQYTVTLTVHFISCDPAHPVPKDVSVPLTIIKT